MSIMRDVRWTRGQRVVMLCAGVMLLAGCGSTAGYGSTSGYGTLSGRLLMVGGAKIIGSDAQPSPWPVAGSVVATGPDGSHTADAGADGRYTLQLPPGTYTVTGTSAPGADNACHANGRVSVGPNQQLTADVYCVVP